MFPELVRSIDLLGPKFSRNLGQFKPLEKKKSWCGSILKKYERLPRQMSWFFICSDIFYTVKIWRFDRPKSIWYCRSSLTIGTKKILLLVNLLLPCLMNETGRFFFPSVSTKVFSVTDGMAVYLSLSQLSAILLPHSAISKRSQHCQLSRPRGYFASHVQCHSKN